MNLFTIFKRLFSSRNFQNLFPSHKSLVTNHYSQLGLAPLVIIVVVALIAAAVPTTIILVQQEQDNRQLAQSSTDCSQYNNNLFQCTRNKDACDWKQTGKANEGTCTNKSPTPTSTPIDCTKYNNNLFQCTRNEDTCDWKQEGKANEGLCINKNTPTPTTTESAGNICKGTAIYQGDKFIRDCNNNFPPKVCIEANGRAGCETPKSGVTKPTGTPTPPANPIYDDCRGNANIRNTNLEYSCYKIDLAGICPSGWRQSTAFQCGGRPEVCCYRDTSGSGSPEPTPTTPPSGGGDTAPTRTPPTLTPTPSPVASPFCQGRGDINTSAPNTRNGYVGVRCGNYLYGTDGQRAGLGCGGQFFDLFVCNDSTTQAYACSTPECIAACNTTTWCPIPSPTPELSPSPIVDGGGSGRTTRKLPGDSCSADSECFSLTCMPAVNSTNKYCVSSLGVRFCEEKGQEVTGPNIYANCPKN